ncbi:hypothetical protein A3Q56_05775 [Intoshia linei]|uniref:Amiloride-sensitive sodium channel subunit alpha n=1 Tax=Intoshia linei TaxID=1819745 RepID=A0A177AYN0_9BILA|nr:hypothetical protein A3Q56_05775 [Intoshia linei]
MFIRAVYSSMACIKNAEIYGITTSDEFSSIKSKNLNCHQTVIGFPERTSAHGIPHIYFAKGIIKSVFWSILFIAALCGLGYNLYKLISKYISYDVNVVLKLKYERNLIFPAVTICNNNPVKYSLVIKDDSFKSVFEKSARKRRAIDPNDPAYDPNLDPTLDTYDPTLDTKDPALDTYDPALDANDPAFDAYDLALDAYDPALDAYDPALDVYDPDLDIYDPNSNDQYLDPSFNDLYIDTGGFDPNMDHYDQNFEDPGLFDSFDQKQDFENIYGEGVDIRENPYSSEFNNFFEEGFQADEISDVAGISFDGEVDANADESNTYQEYNIQFSQDDIVDTPFEEGSYTDESGRISNSEDDIKMEFLAILNEKSIKDREKLGYQFKDFVLNCNYNGYNCLKKDFINFYTNSYGNCYTFNSGWNTTHPIYRSYKPGAMHGLKVTLFIDQNEYIPEMVHSAGAKVLVHAQKIMPFPEDEGYNVSPGMATSIAVRKTSIKRAGSVYSPCTDIQAPNITRNIYEELYPTRYNTPACLKTCYQKNVIDTCSCYYLQIPNYGSAFGYKNVSGYECLAEITKLYDRNKLNCSCPSPCQETSFSSSISTALWPSTKYEGSLKNILRGKKSVYDVIEEDKKNKDNQFQKNILKINIFYQEFNYETITEEPAYLFFSLISDVGGILGLYIGFSAMTIFEFMELGADLLYISCNKIRRRSVKPDSLDVDINKKNSSFQELNNNKLVKLEKIPSLLESPIYTNV